MGADGLVIRIAVADTGLGMCVTARSVSPVILSAKWPGTLAIIKWPGTALAEWPGTLAGTVALSATGLTLIAADTRLAGTFDSLCHYFSTYI